MKFSLLLLSVLLPVSGFAMTQEQAAQCQPTPAMEAAGEAAQPAINMMSADERKQAFGIIVQLADAAKNCDELSQQTVLVFQKLAEAKKKADADLMSPLELFKKQVP